jgi:hypothetical protein
VSVVIAINLGSTLQEANYCSWFYEGGYDFFKEGLKGGILFLWKGLEWYKFVPSCIFESLQA